jgi:exodeoxyribonuclease V beta subunit
MKAFDLIQAPLTGTRLIEASAGTGKTYTIAGLFVRLIIELGLTVDQILVVTYTKAATEELKTRIRNKLLQTRQGFVGGKSDDPLVAALIRNDENRHRAVRVLGDAIVDYDQASIYTIHGFCQRILHENAFETGNLYDTELITDPTEIYREVADDFWRIRFYNAPLEFIRFAAAEYRVTGPSYFFRLHTGVHALDLDVLPSIEEPALDKLEKYRNTYRLIAAEWKPARSAVMTLLKDDALNAQKYGSLSSKKGFPVLRTRDGRVAALTAAMDRFVDRQSERFPLFKDFEKFTATYLAAATRRNRRPPAHPFFDLCDRLHSKAEELQSEMAQRLLFLKAEYFRYAQSELATRKAAKNIQFYDDLLMTVHRALENDAGANLLDSIRHKYKAALVDEFQDTDTIQYKIFSKIFGGPQYLLFMIGDPKQSIYSFRGADIFSYMTAASRADSKYTLHQNWRSDAGLIKAVNTIFSRCRDPFLFNEIKFEQGRAGNREEPAAGPAKPPLNLCFLPATGDKPVNKTDAVHSIAAAVADEIARLISCEQGPVAPGDIAVLVRTNRQAQLIQNNLSQRQVPCVLYSSGNIFDSREAMEMERVLAGIAEYQYEERFRSALTTDMIGVCAAELDAADDEPDRWERRRTGFKAYFDEWHRDGFVRMFRLFMAREGIKSRLLAFTDGDRRLTNVLHLTEILHQEATDNRRTMTGLLKWLSDQRQPAAPRLEEHQLRLESDALAVKIVTIHKSKGLEYRVVFCPFSWEGSTLRKGQQIVFHNQDAERRLSLDLGSDHLNRHKVQAQHELLAENLRVLYVAITRAKSHCYLVWGNINSAETSAMAYLFHCPEVARETDVLAAMRTHLAQKKAPDLIDDLQRLAGDSEGTIQVSVLADQSEKNVAKDRTVVAQPLDCRKFAGKIDKSWKIASYSSLVAHQHPEVELPDHDIHLQLKQTAPAEEAAVSMPATQAAARSIFNFPKGARAGIFFHDIFEQLDFADQATPHRDQLIVAKLREYGYAPEWKDVIAQTIENTLSVPLLTDGGHLTLATVSRDKRINEMEFYYPLKPVTPRQLKQVFARHGGVEIPSDFELQLQRLTFSPANGFLKGYVDMIFEHQNRFFVLDWKSNHLGNRVEDYDQENIRKTMSSEYYILQYCLYTLAFKRYMQARSPNFRFETDFGGVIYVFIRGIDAEKGPRYGIYFKRPGTQLIDALDRQLIP